MACESGKRNKPTFNATTNTQPRRYNKMMCSTWKISVFGIVALMLSFGLVAGDAFAHSNRHTSHPAAPNAVNHFDDATLTAVVNSSVTPTPPALPAANGNGGGIMRSG